MNLRTLLIVLGGLVFAASIMFSVMTGSGNTVGSTILWLAIGGALISLFSPRSGLVFLVLYASMADLLKRLMVFDAHISQFDIAFSLAGGPLCVSAALIGLLLHQLKSGQKIEKIDYALVALGLIGMVYGAATSLGGGLSLRVGWQMINLGLYAFIPLIVWRGVGDRHELMKVMKVAMFAFVPVVAYAFIQRYVGLADFEYSYLISGHSVEVRQLLDASSGIRPFSTLSSASSLTMVCATLAMVSILAWKGKFIPRVAAAFFFIAYCLGTYVSFTRTGWVALVLAMVMALVLQRPKLMPVLVAMGLGALAFLIVRAEWILSELPMWQTAIYSSLDEMTPDGKQGFRIMTLQDRLVGFVNMGNLSNWTPFGLEEGEGKFVKSNAGYTHHDMFTSLFFSFGYIPVGFLVLMGLGFLVWLGRAIDRLPGPLRGQAGIVFGGSFGLLVSILAGGYLFQYPANIFFWLFVSHGVLCLAEPVRVQGEESVESEVVVLPDAAVMQKS